MEFKAEIKAPWDDRIVVANEKDDNWHLKWIPHFIKQLEYYIKANTSPNVEYTQSDIDGYKELLATGDEKIAARFFELKHTMKTTNKKMPHNKDVIQIMKDNNEWISYQ